MNLSYGLLVLMGLVDLEDCKTRSIIYIITAPSCIPKMLIYVFLCNCVAFFNSILSRFNVSGIYDLADQYF